MKLAIIIVLMATLTGTAFGDNVRRATAAVRNKNGTPPAEAKIKEGVREEKKGEPLEEGPEPKYGYDKLWQVERNQCVAFDSGGFAMLVPCYMGSSFTYDDNRLIIASNGPVGRCLSVDSDDFVLAETCDFSREQDWYGVRVSDYSYTYRLLNRKTLKFLDDHDGGPDDGYLDVVSDKPYQTCQYFGGLLNSFFA